MFSREVADCVNSYKIVHRIINSAEDNSVSHTFHIHGREDCLFESIPKILEFYSGHYLNQSPLVKPVTVNNLSINNKLKIKLKLNKKAFNHKKVLTLYDFTESEDSNEDLYFKKNEILTILEYTQGEHWWKAVNRSGRTGLIPATLVRRLRPVSLIY